MTITLKTQRQDQLLELSDFRDDSYVWGFTLRVRSDNFMAIVPMSHYDTSWLKKFVEQLNEMDNTTAGEATLNDEDGQRLRFKLNQLGHLRVSGYLFKSGETKQELNFEFDADQTCLKPFVAELSKIIASD